MSYERWFPFLLICSISGLNKLSSGLSFPNQQGEIIISNLPNEITFIDLVSNSLFDCYEIFWRQDSACWFRSDEMKRTCMELDRCTLVSSVSLFCKSFLDVWRDVCKERKFSSIDWFSSKAQFVSERKDESRLNSFRLRCSQVRRRSVSSQQFQWFHRTHSSHIRCWIHTSMETFLMVNHQLFWRRLMSTINLNNIFKVNHKEIFLFLF